VSEAAAKRIERRASQWAALGVGVRTLDAAETQAKTGTAFYRAAWIDPRGGQLQPLSYARELARAALEAGVEIYVRTPATRLTREGDARRVETGRHSVTAGAVLLCTNAYTGKLVPGLDRTIIPASSVIAATEPLPPALRREVMPSAMPISDTRRLLSYMRFDAAGRFLIGARGSFGLHEPDSDFRHLGREAETIFPQLVGVPWQSFWGGRFALTTDHPPHIGNPGDALYYVLGCNGRGVALLSQLGRMLGDLANGLPHHEVPMPMGQVAPIPLHRFRRAGLETVALWYRTLERLEL
jgi:glycine/D-amino acid oxidase-like deaminating enzyme